MIQVPFFKDLPFLVHGFGTRYLTEEFLNTSSRYKNFRKLYLDQKHSDTIHCIDREFFVSLEGDGLITDIPHVILIIKTADCLPALLVDVDKKVIGAVHCGWRGTGKKIIQKALKMMAERYLSRYSSLWVALGPCICGKCYEVGTDVVRYFEDRNIPLNVFKKHPEDAKKYFLDLRKANQIQLQELGVKKDKIQQVGICTYGDRNFLSYRRDRSDNRRMLSFIGLSF